MKPIKPMALAVVLTIAVLLSSAAAQQQIIPGDDAIVQRLDEIHRRLEAIEARLRQLENKVHAGTERWLDERGVMRTTDGRPLGFWGIDGRPKTSIR